MKDIHIYAIDPAISDIDTLLRYLLYQYFPLPHHFNFIWDKINPDYIIVRPNIFLYTNKGLLKKFHKYFSNDRIIIMFGDELYLPDLNIFDYAIVYDSQSTSKDRICQFPYITFFFGNNPDFLKNTISIEKAKNLLSNKTDFCNFIYSHQHTFRDQLFHVLSEYKSVDSFGGHLHNKDISLNNGRSASNWLDDSIEIKRNYKFSISVENAVSPGYVTEKIMSSFAANTIPIYFGDPNIINEFNPDSFINCNEYKSINEIVEKVREIDNSDEEFIRILTAPRQTPEQVENYAKIWGNYVSFIDNIFDQDISNAKRRPVGSWNDLYSEWYFRENGALFKKFKKYLFQPKKYMFAIKEFFNYLKNKM